MVDGGGGGGGELNKILNAQVFDASLIIAVIYNYLRCTQKLPFLMYNFGVRNDFSLVPSSCLVLIMLHSIPKSKECCHLEIS